MRHDDLGPPLDGAPAPDRPPGPDGRTPTPTAPRRTTGRTSGSSGGPVRPRGGALPSAVTMPWTVAHPAAPGGKAPGQHGGWLGKAYDPFRVEGDPNAPGFRVGGLGLPEGVSPRPDARPPARSARGMAATGRWPARGRGLGRLPGPGARRAGLGRGPRGVPDRAGRPQDPRPLRPPHPRPVPAAGPPTGRGRASRWSRSTGTTTARTSGTPTATTSTSSRTGLMPPADRGFAALLDDLDARGLLDETLVVWVGEFGRSPEDQPRPTPAASTGRAATRRSWPAAASRGGSVHGASRPLGRLPRPRPGRAPTTSARRSCTPWGSTPPPRSSTPSAAPSGSRTGDPLTSLFG